jgi:hypothetical protein
MGICGGVPTGVRGRTAESGGAGMPLSAMATSGVFEVDAPPASGKFTVSGSGFAGGCGEPAHAASTAGLIIAAPKSTDRTTSLKGDRPL